MVKGGTAMLCTKKYGIVLVLTPSQIVRRSVNELLVSDTVHTCASTCVPVALDGDLLLAWSFLHLHTFPSSRLRILRIESCKVFSQIKGFFFLSFYLSKK